MRKDEKSINNAEKINEELKQLREEKHSQLNKQENKSNKNNQNLIKGYVDSIRNNEQYVDIKVNFNDDGEEKMFIKSISKPTEPDDFTRDNELICLIKEYGDKSKEQDYDATKLLYRTVDIRKISNDSYEIVIPNDISLKSRTKHNIKKRLFSYELIEWDTKLKDIFYSPFFKLLTSIFLIVFSVFSLIDLIGIYPITGLILGGLIGFILLMIANVFLSFIIDSILLKLNIIKEDIYTGIFVTNMITFGFILNMQNSNTEIDILNMGLATSGIIIATLILLSSSDLYLNKILNIYNSIKSKINHKRGIEYIK